MSVKRMILLGFLTILAGWFVFETGFDRGEPLSADKLIRLHVIAHSDSPYDQKIKLQVRDEIIKLMAPYFKEAKTVEEAREMALGKLPLITETANRYLSSLGIAYSAQGELGRFDFPAKAYGNLVLGEGNYEALRVVLGEGQGRNWWCVLYPPLCFLDISNTIGVEAQELSESSDQVKQVGARPVQVEVRFKILDEIRHYFAHRTLVQSNS